MSRADAILLQSAITQEMVISRLLRHLKLAAVPPQIQYWSARSVRVACYNAAGTAADSRFSLLHLSDLSFIR